MLRLPVLSTVACLVLAFGAQAQETADSRSVLASVAGLAAGDLLNIRERASPFAKVLGRLENGSLVNRHECELVEGYEWCRIEAADAQLSGWSPARYLLALDIEEGETLRPDDALSYAAPLPSALEARFADEPATPPGMDDADIAAVEELANRLRSATASRSSPAALTGEETDFSVPVPTARPDMNNGDIPCARHIGQPMTFCAVHVARTGPASADVTVTWPDGGSRIIEFRDGEPVRANAGGELRFTREGTLNMIRIGVAERFEILDALPFGD